MAASSSSWRRGLDGAGRGRRCDDLDIWCGLFSLSFSLSPSRSLVAPFLPHVIDLPFIQWNSLVSNLPMYYLIYLPPPCGEEWRILCVISYLIFLLPCSQSGGREASGSRRHRLKSLAVSVVTVAAAAAQRSAQRSFESENHS